MNQIFVVHGDSHTTPGHIIRTCATQAVADEQAAILVNVLRDELDMSQDATREDWEAMLAEMRQKRADDLEIDLDTITDDDCGHVWVEIQDFIGGTNNRQLVADLWGHIEGEPSDFFDLRERVRDVVWNGVNQQDGYLEAFYKVAALLDLPAMPVSAETVFETEIIPRLKAALADKVDARRWRGMMASDRIRMMGCAGITFENGMPVAFSKQEVHLGMEFWDRHPAKADQAYPQESCRRVLEMYADSLAEAAEKPVTDARDLDTAGIVGLMKPSA